MQIPVVVLLGRAARTQHVMDANLPADRPLDILYAPEVGEMLHQLRDQMRIAQNRNEVA